MPGTNVVVTVSATTMPWMVTVPGNPSFGFNPGDGATPIVAMTGLVAGYPLILSATGGGGVAVSGGRSTYGPDGGGSISSNTPDAATADQLGPASGNFYPTHYMSNAAAVGPVGAGGLCIGGLCGAFTNSSGLVIQAVAIGSLSSTTMTLTVPAGATQFQVGINDEHFSDNTGSFTLTANFTILHAAETLLSETLYQKRLALHASEAFSTTLIQSGKGQLFPTGRK